MKYYPVSQLTGSGRILQGAYYDRPGSGYGYGLDYSGDAGKWLNSRDANGDVGYAGAAWVEYADIGSNLVEYDYTDTTATAIVVSDLLTYASTTGLLTVESDLLAYASTTTYAPVESDVLIYRSTTATATVESDMLAYTGTTTEAIVESDMAAYRSTTATATVESDVLIYTATTATATVESDMLAYTSTTTAAVVESDLNAYHSTTTCAVVESDVLVYTSTTTSATVESDVLVYTSTTTWAVVESDVLIYFSTLTEAVVESDLNTYRGTYAAAIVESDLLVAEIYYGWAMNLENQAVSKYEAFNFNSISPRFGCGAGGIYRLGGSTDNGTVISSFVQTGKLDMATSQIKRVTDYYHMQDGGKLTLSVTADNTPTAIAYTTAATTKEATEKLNLARGAKGRYWLFSLANVAGSAATVREPEIVVETLSRKI